MPRVTYVVLGIVLLTGATACGSDDVDAAPAEQSSSTTKPTISPTSPTSEPPPEPTSEATSEKTSEPEPEPEPLPPNFGTQDAIRDFFDDEIDDIEWQDAPTPKGRPRLLGTVSETYATIELFGQDDAIDEVAYQVVWDGTDSELNFPRSLPMIRMAQEYATEEAAMFVGSELDGFTYLDAIPQQSNTESFDDVFVRVIGIDVVNIANLTLSVGHKPTRP